MSLSHEIIRMFHLLKLVTLDYIIILQNKI